MPGKFVDPNSELGKFGNWMKSWGKNLYETTGKPYPKKPERESRAPQIYSALTQGKTMPGTEVPRPDTYTVMGVTYNAATGLPISGHKDASYTVAGVEYDGKTGRPVNAPETGYSLESGGKIKPHSTVEAPITPETDSETTPAPTPKTPAPGAGGSESSTTRTNENGIVQKGMTLGGVNNFLAAYPELNVADGSKFFDLSGAGGKKVGGQDVGYTKGRGESLAEGVDYKVPDKAKPGAFQKLPENSFGGKNSNSYTVDGASMPLTLGKVSGNPQEGADPQADAADQSRAISMKPFRGSARQQEFANRPGNRPPVSEASAEETPKTDKARSAYSRAFLDSTAKGPMGVLRDAAAAQGVIRTNDGKISIKNGDSYLTYTGDKSAREVAFDLGGGQEGFNKNAADFSPVGGKKSGDDEQTPATIQDTPDISMTAPIKDMSEADQKKAAQVFAQGFVSGISGKLKDK